MDYDSGASLTPGRDYTLAAGDVRLLPTVSYVKIFLSVSRIRFCTKIIGLFPSPIGYHRGDKMYAFRRETLAILRAGTPLKDHTFA